MSLLSGSCDNVVLNCVDELTSSISCALMIVGDESSSSADKAKAVIAEEVSDDDRGDDDEAFIVVDVCDCYCGY